MNSNFFNIKKIDISDNLIIIPNFPDKSYLQMLKNTYQRKRKLLDGELLSFSRFEIIHGFLGYPSLLTKLEFIKDIKKKNIFFLGTAGSLNREINFPTLLNVHQIYSGKIFEHFSSKEKYTLNRVNCNEIRSVKGVSIDLIQRENIDWLSLWIKKSVDIVEMEIFPLRWYTGKNLTAFVVTTDQVTESGIVTYKDKKTIKDEAVRGFEMIKELIDEA